jgi:hypothetical protein
MSTAIILVALFFMIFIFAVVVYFIIKKKKESESSGTGACGGNAGGISLASGSQILENLSSTSEDTSAIATVVKMIKGMAVPGAIGIAAGAATSKVIKGLSPKGRESLIKGFKKSTNFLRATRSRTLIKAPERSFGKFLSRAVARGASAFATTRLGSLWSGGARNTARLEAQVAARQAARAETTIARRTATVAAQSSMEGPIAALEIGIAVGGMALDMSKKGGVGGYLNIMTNKTSDLLVQSIDIERIQAESYINGPKDENDVVDSSSAVGFYPAYWGPLDVPALQAGSSSGSPDVLTILVETKMWEMMTDPTNPDPFIINLLSNLSTQCGVTPDMVEAALSTINQDEFDALYDKAFDALCTEKGGILVDPGVGNRKKQCSYATEAACHAAAPWSKENPQPGDYSGPVTAGNPNYQYTEWRSADVFKLRYGNGTPEKPAKLPAGAAGACIIQDVSGHILCDGGDQTTASGHARNSYIRNLGVCQNSEDVCKKSGTDFCRRMPKQNQSGDSCETGFDGKQADLGPGGSYIPDGTTLQSCYVSTGDEWGKALLPIGDTAWAYVKSGQLIKTLGAVTQLEKPLTQVGNDIKHAFVDDVGGAFKDFGNLFT